MRALERKDETTLKRVEETFRALEKDLAQDLDEEELEHPNSELGPAYWCIERIISTYLRHEEEATLSAYREFLKQHQQQRGEMGATLSSSSSSLSNPTIETGMKLLWRMLRLDRTDEAEELIRIIDINRSSDSSGLKKEEDRIDKIEEELKRATTQLLSFYAWKKLKSKASAALERMTAKGWTANKAIFAKLATMFVRHEDQELWRSLMAYLEKRTNNNIQTWIPRTSDYYLLRIATALKGEEVSNGNNSGDDSSINNVTKVEDILVEMHEAEEFISPEIIDFICVSRVKQGGSKRLLPFLELVQKKFGIPASQSRFYYPALIVNYNGRLDKQVEIAEIVRLHPKLFSTPFMMVMLLQVFISAGRAERVDELQQMWRKKRGEAKATEEKKKERYSENEKTIIEIAESEEKFKPLDAKTHKLIISFWFAKGDYARLLESMQEMHEDGVALPNEVYENVLQELAASFEAGLVENILNAATTHAKFKPTSKTYSALIQMWVQLGEVDKVEEILRRMQSEGIVPSVEVYNPLIAMWISRNETRKAKELIELMQESGVAFNAQTCALLIGLCNDEEKGGGDLQSQTQRLSNATVAERINGVLEYMKMCDIPMTTTVYASLLRVWSDREEIDQVRGVLRQMTESKANALDWVTFEAIDHIMEYAKKEPSWNAFHSIHALFIGLVVENNIEEVTHCLNAILHRHSGKSNDNDNDSSPQQQETQKQSSNKVVTNVSTFSKDVKLYNLLIAFYAQHGQVEAVTQLTLTMKQNKVEGNEFTNRCIQLLEKYAQ